MIKEKSKTWFRMSLWLGRHVSTYLPFPPVFYSISTLFLAAAAVIASFQHYFVTAILLFLVSGFFDVVDGAVARASNRVSHLGAFVDGTIDRFVDFAIIFSYFFFKIEPIGMSVDQLICIASFVVILPSFIVAYANHRKAVVDDDETLIWRFMNRGEMLVLMLSVMTASLFSPTLAGYLLVLFIVFATITILQTILLTLYHAKRHSIC